MNGPLPGGCVKLPAVVGLLSNRPAPQQLFDVLESHKQLDRSEGRLELRRAIQKARLVEHTPRWGLV